MVDHAVAVKGVLARVGHEPLGGPGLLLNSPAEQIASVDRARLAREIVTEKRPSGVHPLV